MKTKQSSTVERNPDFDAQADLVRKCQDLIAIVEGVQSVRWNHEGKRLKDTHEWCAFYVAAKGLSTP